MTNEFEISMEKLHRSCSRILELAVSVWLQRARAIAGDDAAAWAVFLGDIGMSEEDAARHDRELERAKAGGEVLPWPPMPKTMKLKRHPVPDKLAFIASAVIQTQVTAAEPLPIRDAPPAAPSSPPAPTQPAIRQLSTRARPAPTMEPRVQRVYFIQGVDGGPIKIGVSSDPVERLGTLQTASPVKLRIIGLVSGGPSLERGLHVRLAAHRIHGEWFVDAPEVMAAIAEALQ